MRRLGLSVAACLALVCAPAEAQFPDEDPFYAVPADVGKAKRGAILDTREVEVRANGRPTGLTGHQLLYRTTDTKGAPTATVATVILPPGPANSARPLLAYQPPEDTLTRRCASSYEIRNGQTPTEPLGLVRSEGVALVIADYEGPGSHWVAGKMAGRAVLDAVRATEAFEPAGLKGARTPVGLWGYSGGGHATAWAAELAPTYAPELNVVGAAHGGAPYVLRTTIANLDGGPFAGILLAAVVGIGRAYPEMNLDELLNAEGLAMRDAIGKQCLEEFALAYPGATIDQYTDRPDTKDLPNVAAVIADNGLGQRTPTAPLFIYHAATDELNPIAGTDAIVENYCRRGVAVQYERAPAGEHIEYAVRGGALAEAYLSARFAGEPAPNGCTVAPDPTPATTCTVTVRFKQRFRRAVARVAGRRLVVRDRRRVRIGGLAAGRYRVKLRIRTTDGVARTFVVRRTAKC